MIVITSQIITRRLFTLRSFIAYMEMAQNSQKLSWTAEEVDTRLRQIMKGIHHQCELYGKQADGYINYVKGANVAGFM